MNMKCGDCRHWRKLRDVPMGLCRLPQAKGLTMPAWDEPAAGDEWLPNLPLLMTDMDVCSEWEFGKYTHK